MIVRPKFHHRKVQSTGEGSGGTSEPTYIYDVLPDNLVIPENTQYIVHQSLDTNGFDIDCEGTLVIFI